MAAEFIGIELLELKHATLYRALCEYPSNEEYVEHCLRVEGDERFDVNWLVEYEVSILEVAAAFASSEICKFILDRPNVLINATSPHGLTLLHIAVSNGNLAMVQQLVLKHDLEIETVWKPEHDIGPLHPASHDRIEWQGWAGEHPIWTALEMANMVLLWDETTEKTIITEILSETLESRN